MRLPKFVCVQPIGLAGIVLFVGIVGTSYFNDTAINQVSNSSISVKIDSVMPKHFDNHMEDFGTAESKEYLNVDLSAISDTLRNKIQTYINEKLKDLLKEKEQIFSSGSVYTGSAGIALLLYERAKLKSEPAKGDGFREALSYVEGGKGGRESAPSFLCGAAGPLALAAVLAYHLGQPHIPHLQRLSSLMEIAEHPSTPDELLYGRAGYLYSLLFVNKETGQEMFSNQTISKVVELILESGRKQSLAEGVSEQCPLLFHWHDSVYLGGAHGTAGILLLLLQAGAPCSAELLGTLDWLGAQRYPSGNLPSSLGSSADRLVQWCHGAPGLVQPLLLAHRLLAEERHLQNALRCGDVVWQRGLTRKGYSLCHGVAGNAYTFLHLFQATRDPRWLYRAARFAEWVMEEAPGTELHAPDHPASLFEGLAGRLLFLQDMLHPQQANFPAYTL